MEFLFNLFGLHSPKNLFILGKEQILKLLTHVMYWLDRGPFAQEKSGFDRMINLSRDPLLVDYFESKLSNGQRTINLGLIVQEYIIVVDPKLATIIFRNTIPYFIPAMIEKNLKSALAPTQTTLSMGKTWIKRRCLSENALDWTPSGFTIPLETTQAICPYKREERFGSSLLAIRIINRWFEHNGLPTENWTLLDNLAMKIVFGNTEETDKMVLYMKQAQSLASVFGSSEMPDPNLRLWYRDYLRTIVLHPPIESLAYKFVETARNLDYDYISEEIEDQLPFAFFQISALFKVFLPIALALACIHVPSLIQFERITYDMIFTNRNYLHYFTMEVMRLYNQVFILQREASQDIRIDDFYIKKGDQLNLMFAFYMRDPLIYPEPNRFNPERWSEEYDINWTLGQHPFSSGSRTCPARNFAVHIAKHVIFYLLKNPNYRYVLLTDIFVDFMDMPQVINPYNLKFTLESRL